MADGTAEMQSLVDGLCALDHDGAVTVLTSVLQARPELAPAVVQFSVPDLTYPPSKALIERRSTGVIKSFSEEKGFGFIACEELFNTFGNDVFLHRAQLGPYGVGANVSFAVMLNKENKPQGYDLMAQGAKGGKGGSFGGGSFGGGSWGGDKGSWGGDKGGWGMGCWGGPSPWMTPGGKGGMKGPPGKAGGKICGGGGVLGPGCNGLAKGCKGGKGGKSGDDSQRKVGPKRDSSSEMEQLGSHAGIIKSFNDKTGYGFIECPELKQQYGNDVFLHYSDFEGFQVGEQVEFAAYLNSNGKPQAKELQSAGGGKRQKTGDFSWGEAESEDAFAEAMLG